MSGSILSQTFFNSDDYDHVIDLETSEEDDKKEEKKEEEVETEQVEKEEDSIEGVSSLLLQFAYLPPPPPPAFVLAETLISSSRKRMRELEEMEQRKKDETERMVRLGALAHEMCKFMCEHQGDLHREDFHNMLYELKKKYPVITTLKEFDRRHYDVINIFLSIGLIDFRRIHSKNIKSHGKYIQGPVIDKVYRWKDPMLTYDAENHTLLQKQSKTELVEKLKKVRESLSEKKKKLAEVCDRFKTYMQITTLNKERKNEKKEDELPDNGTIQLPCWFYTTPTTTHVTLKISHDATEMNIISDVPFDFVSALNLFTPIIQNKPELDKHIPQEILSILHLPSSANES